MTAATRPALFAKIFNHGDRQVLVYLMREEEDLAILAQVWIAASDEQYRCLVQFESDDQAEHVFDWLDDTTLEDFLAEVGASEEIAALEGNR